VFIKRLLGVNRIHAEL